MIEIDEKSIFLNDMLDREDAIKNLSAIIETTTNSFVLSINADWGSGKTTFVKLLQTYLKKEKNINSIYFSAWEDDFSKEPLISILGEVKKYIVDNFPTGSEQSESFEDVKAFVGKVLKRSVPAFLKGITGGVLNFDKDFDDAIGAIAESAAKELIDNYLKDKEVMQEFKKSIKDLLSKINDSKPFVIFIDELDRCRPLYAIELLERIKHIFGIDGLVFVLSVDTKQLSESIKSQYGNIDAKNYLRRFIDMEYSLKNPSIDQFCAYLYRDVYQLHIVLKEKQIKKEDPFEYDELAMLKYLAKSLELSLREIEQVFIELRIIFKTVELRLFELHFRIIVLLVILKMKFPQQYELLKRQSLPEQEIIDLLVMKKTDGLSSRVVQIIIKAIVFATGKSNEQLEQIISEQKIISTTLTDQKEQEEQNWLIDMLEHNTRRYGGYILNKAIDTVINKIEFIDSFNFEVMQ
jgi:predicted KAP-like P-loop ATPase